MMARAGRRKAVRKFFDFEYKESNHLFYKICLAVLALLGPVVGFCVHASGEPPARAVAASALFFVASATVLTVIKVLLCAIAEFWRHCRYQRLGRKTQAIQAKDIEDAFLRIFQRTQLDINDLRTLDERYQLTKEKNLFRNRSLERRVGELYNKSIRMLSQPREETRGTKEENGDHEENGVKAEKSQKKPENKMGPRFLRSRDGGIDILYNPIRLIALLLTTEELVICDATIDSIKGDLEEHILRLMISDVVSVSFCSERKRFTMDLDEILFRAKAMRFSQSKRRKIKRDYLNRHKREPQYIQEDLYSDLEVSQTDSQALTFPMRYELFIGKRRGGLHDVSLSEDDKVIDRMVNELNRVVRSSRQAKTDDE
jgi:hypothetical protein